MNQHDRGTRLFHWLMAVLIVGVWAGGRLAVGLPRGPQRSDVFAAHFAAGLCVLVLLVGRAAWRLRAPALPPSTALSRLENGLARAGHLLFYLLMLAAPLTGWGTISATGRPVKIAGLELPALVGRDHDLHEALETAHVWIVYTLGVLVIVHVVEIYRHREALLHRMWPR